ncbi:MAG: polymer-forming cytoskeletal protein [Ruminococcaceae bacterium]|nr:polymer-forming cytoskeletal protein [Oscillospiraceae bacterium]
MSAKENLNEAMFSMFGVGKDPNAAENPPKATPAAPAPVAAPQNVARQDTAVTYLAPGSVMEGKLKTKGDVNIAGDFTGDITATGKVTLHSNLNGNVTAANVQLVGCRLVGDIIATGVVVLDSEASVEGKITASDLICAGHVKGDLEIRNNIALKANTSVEGNIVTGSMTMEQGAIINGSMTMKPAAKKAEEEKK